MSNDIKNLRIEALEWAERNLVGKQIFSTPIQKFIYFSGNGVDHALSNNYEYAEIEFKIIKQLPRILLEAQYAGDEKNYKKSKLGRERFHTFYTLAEVDGILHKVWIKAIEYTNKRIYFYDFGIAK